MSLRLTALLFLLLLAVPGQALAGSASTNPRSTFQVTEQLPWFDQAGVNFTYSVSGTSPGQLGAQTYLGSTSVQVLGIASNGSLVAESSATASNAILPNGTFYDDPFFPSYVQVLPQAFVAPRSFTVVAPSYALSFTYLGNVSQSFEGGTVQAYAFSVQAAASGQGQSEIVKYYRVLPSDGLILQVELSNTNVGSTLTLTLASLARPSSASAPPLTFPAPVYALPGNFLTYTNPASGQQIRYATIFSEARGLFAYERTSVSNGTAAAPQFFVDDFYAPLFYPASLSFGDAIAFPVAVGSLETGTVTWKGNTTVSTPLGRFDSRAYANQSIGFEAYLDVATGVAVYLELPGGNLEAASSNFLVPLPQQANWVFDLVPIGIVVVVAALLLSHFRSTTRKPRRRK